jgi:hypothetical protein
VATPRPIVDLSQQILTGLSDGLAHIGMFGLGKQMSAAEVQLDDHLMLRCAAFASDPNLGADFLFEILQSSIDLFEVMVDGVDIALLEVVPGGRYTDPHAVSFRSGAG